MLKKIYWNIQDFKNLPEDNKWLSNSEKQILDTFRFAKRRSEWLLGRWVVKNTLQKHLNKPLNKIEVLPSKNGAPYLITNKKEEKLAFSISHRERKAICVFSDQFDSIGCDLEYIEPRSNIFINDYFSSDEIKHISNRPDQKNLLSNLIWSAKESVSKVLQIGLNLDTLDVNVHTLHFSDKSDWNALKISLKKEKTFFGFWKKTGNYVITVAAKEPFEPPRSI